MCNKQEKKKKVLKDSPLWKGLLLDKEIRYSDFLGLFMELTKKNPFDENIAIVQSDIRIRREKKHIDLWIEKVEYDKNKIDEDDIDKKEFEEDVDFVPLFLVENKLKSIPFQEQLNNYTDKFVKEYINQIKKKIKREYPVFKGQGKKININKIESEVNEEYQKNYIKKFTQVKDLKFFLLSLTDFKPQKVYIDKPKVISECETKLNQNNNNNELEFEWKHISYIELSNNIKKLLKDKKWAKNIKKKYIKDMFNDFAQILNSMSIFSEEIGELNDEEKIKNCFKPSGIFTENGFTKMDNFFQKYRASQCAKALVDKIKDEKMVSVNKLNVRDISKKENKNKIFIDHSYTNGAGLFDIKIIVSENVIYVIQYQSGQLRKGLIVNDDEIAKKNFDWFIDSKQVWKLDEKPLKFITKKESNYNSNAKDIFNYFSDKKDYVFYYSFCDVGNAFGEEHKKRILKTSEVIDLMVNYIDKEYYPINI